MGQGDKYGECYTEKVQETKSEQATEKRKVKWKNREEHVRRERSDLDWKAILQFGILPRRWMRNQWRRYALVPKSCPFQGFQDQGRYSFRFEQLRCAIMGADSYGQQGHETTAEMRVHPVEVKSLPQDVLDDISCITGGGGHTVILTTSGKLYSAGWNNKGQLGYKTPGGHSAAFKLIEKLSKHHIISISCGWDFTAAVDVNGRLFTWGSNSFGQLGLPRSQVKDCTHEPAEVPLPYPAKTVSAGLRHAAVVTVNFSVFMWGSDRRGQLGTSGGSVADIKLPHSSKPNTWGTQIQQIEGPNEVQSIPLSEDVTCGQNSTMILAKNGKVYSFGDNKFGTLSIPKEDITTEPVCVPDHHFGAERLTALKLGWTHGIALTCEGNVYTWGRNNYGQLGRLTQEDQDYHSIQVILPNKCTKVCCGSEHCLVALKDNTVMSWGFNEHGTCGIGSHEKMILSPAKVLLPPKNKPIMIGGGYGCSFCLIAPVTV
ncbi:unnamed protein product [Darwinula stevensoni]|uniref:RCC1-like domain-containing protein n=1 Tax=Darwinula stevensoni TaxID=69355 RepID=A0A7R8ZXP0_9CRUS|nr:unnamed protein product [Darwinula stevensoni]CAG0879762.1 unnamed protein product [Darwinula stevensoni]